MTKVPKPKFDTKMVDALAAAENEEKCNECASFRTVACPDANWDARSPIEHVCVFFEEGKR